MLSLGGSGRGASDVPRTFAVTFAVHRYIAATAHRLPPPLLLPRSLLLLGLVVPVHLLGSEVLSGASARTLPQVKQRTGMIIGAGVRSEACGEGRGRRVRAGGAHKSVSPQARRQLI